MDLRMEPVRRRSGVKALYTAAFPAEERMPFWLMLIMGRLPRTEFLSFSDGGRLCGFVYMATVKGLTFLMFLAVDGALRSMGYGSAILEAVQTLHPESKLVVSIEPCDEADAERRLRRKGFYVRNGYEETGYFMELAGQRQEVLVKNGAFDPGEFSRFFLRYSGFTVRPRLWRAGGREG